MSFGAVSIGIWALVFHLDSQFFADFTIKSLVYTAHLVWGGDALTHEPYGGSEIAGVGATGGVYSVGWIFR